MRSRPRGILRAAAVVALGTVAVTAAVLGAAGPAQAHNRVVASTPAAGSTLTALPKAGFSITTDLPMLALQGSRAGFLLDVADASGRHYGDGCVTIVDATMTEEDVTLGAPGAYTVNWQLVSQDGHPVSGSYDFTWAPSGDVKQAKGAATAPRCGEAGGSSGSGSGSGASSTPAAADDSEGRGPDVPLGDLLWIGGAVLAVLVAAGVTLLVVTRRRPGSPGD